MHQLAPRVPPAGALYVIATRQAPRTYFGAVGPIGGSTVFAYSSPRVARAVAIGLELHKQREGEFPRPYGECDLEYAPDWSLRELDLHELDDRGLRELVRGSGVNVAVLDESLGRPLRLRDPAYGDPAARLQFLLRLVEPPAPAPPRRRPFLARLALALLVLLR